MTTIRPIPDRPWEQDPEVEGEPWSADEEVPESAMGALLGGGGATMSAAGDDGQGLARVWGEAGRKLKEAIFGHPDRAEAKEAGIGLQPTLAEMVETGAAGAAAMGAGGGVGWMSRGAAAHPIRTALGYAGSELGEKVGGTPGAVIGGVVAGGLPTPGRLRSAAPVALDVLEALSPARAAAARRVLGSAGRRAGQEAVEAAPLQSEVAERTLRQSGRAGIPEQGPRSWLPAEAAPARGGNVAQFPAPAAPSAAQAQADEIKDFILRGRTKHGLSGAQIVDGLRQIHGIPPSAGQKMVSDVLESLKGAK